MGVDVAAQTGGHAGQGPGNPGIVGGHQDGRSGGLGQAFQGGGIGGVPGNAEGLAGDAEKGRCAATGHGCERAGGLRAVKSHGQPGAKSLGHGLGGGESFQRRLGQAAVRLGMGKKKYGIHESP